MSIALRRNLFSSTTFTRPVESRPAALPRPVVRDRATDSFTPATRAAAPSAPRSNIAALDRTVVETAYVQMLGRAPTADELQKSAGYAAQQRAAGRTPDEVTAHLKFFISLTPEWQATSAYQDKLGRKPSADELQKSIAWGTQLQGEGKSVGEMRAAFDFVLALSPEFQGREAYQQALQRLPSADEQAKIKSFGEKLQAEGKSVGEMRAAFDFVIALSPEFQARGAYENALHRLPTGDELSKMKAWGETLTAEGKQPGEIRQAFDFVLALTPEFQASAAYGDKLGRVPTPDELQKSIAWGKQMEAEGKSFTDVRAAFDFVLTLTPEFQARDAYQQQLGRLPNGDEQARMKEFGERLQSEGKSVGEMRQAFDFVIALTPEWQARNRPAMNANRDEIYLQQPNGWSCGPTSLTMALAAAGVRPSNLDTMWEVANALGARAGVGTPGGVSLIADVARRFGVNAEANSSRDPADVRAALERGHGVVVNGDISGAGHFIYISGLDAQGQYIVCDPWRPGITRWNDGDLHYFTHIGSNPPGFAEIWPG